MDSDAAIKEFERCWPWIESALDRFAYKHDGKVWLTHNKEHVWERITSGKSIFWPGKACAIISEIAISPTGLKTHVTWLAGGDLEEIAELMEKVEEFGRLKGCQRQVGNGRRGWLRVFKGYEEHGVRKAKDLCT